MNQCNNPCNCAHNVRCLAMSKTIAIFVAAAVSAVAASPYTVALRLPPVEPSRSKAQRRVRSRMPDGVVVGTVAAGAVVVGAVVAGAGVLAADLLPGRSSAERSQHHTTVATTAADPTSWTTGIMAIPATTPNRAVAVAAWNTACNDSGATIQIPDCIWATMAVAIRVRRKAGRKQKTPASCRGFLFYKRGS